MKRQKIKNLAPALWLSAAILLAVSPLLGKDNVSQTQGFSTAPRLATDSSGRSHVVWWEKPGSRGDVYYSVGTGNQDWSTPVNLSQSGYVTGDCWAVCDIDVDSSGRVYVIWVEGPSAKLRICSDGSWGSVFTMASGQASYNAPKIAVDPEGNIFAIWSSTDFTAYSRARVNGTWEEVRTLARSAKFTDIGVGSERAFACWMEKGGGLYKIKYSERSKSYNSTWSSGARISTTNSSLEDEYCAVECDLSNNPHFVWSYYLEGGGRRMTYARREGGFSPTETISSDELLHYPSMHHQGGVLYACWQFGSWGGGLGIRYNIRKDGQWTGVQTVPDSRGCTFGDICASPQGNAANFVWDSGGEIYFVSVPLSIAPNLPPVALFSFSPTTGEYPLQVNFDASSSYDPDGKVVEYKWRFGDGNTGTGRVVKHTYKKKGTFKIQLAVTDDRGGQAGQEQSIVVLKPNVPPQADFNFSPATGIYPLEVFFDGSLSRDPDGQIVSWAWSFSDGMTGEGTRLTRQFSRWGSYSIRLTVTDDRGATDNKTRNFKVLRLFQPLNIRWQTFIDEGLFSSRYVTEVSWDRNPENDAIARIVAFRIYRKKTGEALKDYKQIQQVGADTFNYRDSDVGGSGLFDYTVTSVDDKGHESPILQSGTAVVSARGVSGDTIRKK